MPRPDLAKREARAKVIAPLFHLLESEGRKKIWLAQQLGIDSRKLSDYEHGVTCIPQALFDEACRIVHAPDEIRAIRVPTPHPGKYDRTKRRNTWTPQTANSMHVALP